MCGHHAPERALPSSGFAASRPGGFAKWRRATERSLRRLVDANRARHRDADGEGAALVETTLHTQRAAMRFDDPARQHQAESDPGGVELECARRMVMERIATGRRAGEQRLQPALLDPDAVVAHLDHQLLVVPEGAHLDPPA